MFKCIIFFKVYIPEERILCCTCGSNNFVRVLPKNLTVVVKDYLAGKRGFLGTLQEFAEVKYQDY